MMLNYSTISCHTESHLGMRVSRKEAITLCQKIVTSIACTSLGYRTTIHLSPPPAFPPNSAQCQSCQYTAHYQHVPFPYHHQEILYAYPSVIIQGLRQRRCHLISFHHLPIMQNGPAPFTRSNAFIDHEMLKPNVAR